MNLWEAKEGEEYIIKEIVTDDEELNAFFVFPRVLQRRTDYCNRPPKRRMRGICKRWQI